MTEGSPKLHQPPLFLLAAHGCGSRSKSSPVWFFIQREVRHPGWSARSCAFSLPTPVLGSPPSSLHPLYLLFPSKHMFSLSEQLTLLGVEVEAGENRSEHPLTQSPPHPTPAQGALLEKPALRNLVLNLAAKCNQNIPQMSYFSVCKVKKSF